MEEIPYVNLSAQWGEENEELLPIIQKVLASGQYVGGAEVAKYEKEISEAFNVEHVVAVNSGTDALILGLSALGIGPGDEVITPPIWFLI